MPGARDQAGSSLLGILLVLVILGAMAGVVYVTMGPGTSRSSVLDMAGRRRRRRRLG